MHQVFLGNDRVVHGVEDAMIEAPGATELEVEIGACGVTFGASALVIPHLTSGLALCLHDGGDVAGVAYALRGRSSPGERAAAVRPALFVDLAIPALLHLMDERGARRERRAVLVGGAVGLDWRRAKEAAASAADVARVLLQQLGIPILHEVVGGSLARTLAVDGNGRVQIGSSRDRNRVLSFVAAGQAGGLR
jgi:chemotaxis receptor (MCP) glutamine deamidase CheD